MRAWPLAFGVGGAITFGAQRVLVAGVTCMFATSVAVGNRRVGVTIADSTGNIKLIVAASGPQAANDFVNYSFYDGLSSVDGGINKTVAWPPNLILEEGDIMTVGDLNGVSGTDSASAVVAVIEAL